MKKDLHNMDEVFNSAYKQLEEDPSPDVWEKINTGLDNKNTKSSKKRLIAWKRPAILLLLLLAGFMLYESNILKTGAGYSNKNRVTIAPTKENEITNKGHALPEKINNNESNSIDNKNLSTNKKNNNIMIISEDYIRKNKSDKSLQQQNKLSDERKKAIKENNQTEISLIPDTNKKGVMKNNESLIEEKTVDPLIGKNFTVGVIAGLLKKIESPQSPVIHDPVLITSTKKNTNQIRISPYKKYWMISGFISYDQAGYKLDSDEPAAITSIKHREAHEPSFSGGILLTRQMTPRWSLQSGIVYANTAIGMKPQKVYAFQDPTGDVAYKYITSSGYAFIKPGFGPQPVVGDSLLTAEAKHRMENIIVPLIVQYKLMNRKISIVLGAGIEANFKTKANVEVDIEDPFNREVVVVRKLKGTKSFYWSLAADIELRYSVNKKMSVTLRPAYRYALSSITKNNVVETFPHSFGLGAGVTIKF